MKRDEAGTRLFLALVSAILAWYSFTHGGFNFNWFRTSSSDYSSNSSWSSDGGGWSDSGGSDWDSGGGWDGGGWDSGGGDSGSW
jgi:hypothetical protein